MCFDVHIQRTSIPECFISDNGPQYDSYAFKQFTKDWGFDYTTSSPKYAQSKGFVERIIQTVKKTIKRLKTAIQRHGIVMFKNNTN